VAQGVDGDASQGIKVALAIGIPHAQTFAMRHGHGQSAIGVHAMRGCCGRGHVNSKIKNDPTMVEPLKHDFRGALY
jgi:hypothetical protein